MNVRKYAQALVPVAALATSACSMTSEGLELKLEEEGGQALVTLDWQSSDDASGTMIASFPDGRSFRGTYFRITPDTPVEQLEPLWEGWTEARDWPHWQPGANFLEHYSGKVLASLGATNGEHMRCRFKMSRPSSGLIGGGKGKCQLSDGRTVGASIPPARPIGGSVAGRQ
jgi:hypothetical protein